MKRFLKQFTFALLRNIGMNRRRQVIGFQDNPYDERPCPTCETQWEYDVRFSKCVHPDCNSLACESCRKTCVSCDKPVCEQHRAATVEGFMCFGYEGGCMELSLSEAQAELDEAAKVGL